MLLLMNPNLLDLTIKQKHLIDVADISRVNNIALTRAQVTLTGAQGNVQKLILMDVLYISTFKQNIFSVQAATEKGASVKSGCNCFLSPK